MRVIHALAVISIALSLLGGCTDRGSTPLGAGPDDRVDRGTGPDTLTLVVSEDTYFERTVDDGRYLLFGQLPAADFEAVTFVRFENLPGSVEEIEGARLLLYVASDRPPYSFTVSRLEEPAPSELPYWPGPPDGQDTVRVIGASTIVDRKAPLDLKMLRVRIPTSWVAAWIDDPSSNHGVRISGGRLDVDEPGQVQRRFWGGNQSLEGYVLKPRLEIAKSGQDTTRYSSESDFFIFSPSLEEGNLPGELPRLRLGGVYGYEVLMRFPLAEVPDDASVTSASLSLKVDRSVPELNDGIFDVIVRPAVGEWDEGSVNVNVELDNAASAADTLRADEGGTEVLEIDMTALVGVFATGNFFDIALQKTGLYSHNDRVAFVSSEAPNGSDAPSLRIVFTTPPGRRY